MCLPYRQGTTGILAEEAYKRAARPGPSARRARRAFVKHFASACAFLGTAGLLLAYALPGGAYDVVVRQEYGIVLWALLAVGLASGLLPRTRPGRSTIILLVALGAYLLWTALSLRWTESSERTAEELARVLDYIGLVVLLSLALDRRTWRAAAMGLGFAALIVCGLAVASRLLPSLFGHGPLFTPNATNRLSYPFGYWNAVGAWSAMATAIGLAWSAYSPGRIPRAVALGLVPLATMATYLSFSRAALAGTALGVAVVLALSRRRLAVLLNLIGVSLATALEVLVVRGAPVLARGTGTRGAGAVFGAILLAVAISAGTALLTSVPAVARAQLPTRVTRGLLIGGAMVLLVLVASLGPRVGRKAWHQFTHPPVVTSSNPAARVTQLSGTRYDVWSVALEAFKAHPITGTGSGTYGFWWNRHARTTESLRNAHSLELENMAELGTPGLVLIVGVLAAAVLTAVDARRKCRRRASAAAATASLAALAVYILQASVDWMWQSTAVTVLALAGVAIVGVRSGGRSGVGRWYGRVLGVSIALAALLVQLPALVSTAEIRRSQAAERAGNGSLALAWANAATTAEPWSASAYEQRALVLEAGGRFRASARDLRRAIAHERTNYVHWLVLARVETELGQFAAAERDYAEARRLRTQRGVFQMTRAVRKPRRGT